MLLVGYAVASEIHLFLLSSDQCLDELGWPSLKSRRDYLSVSLLYDIHNKVTINLKNFCSFVSSCTRHHSLCIVPLHTTINSFRFSFFDNTPFTWNKIPFNILSLSNRDAFYRAGKNYLIQNSPAVKSVQPQECYWEKDVKSKVAAKKW